MALKIEVTEDCSFCPGVSRAFRITERILFGPTGPAYTVGPLIHNPEVVDRLGLLGLEVIDPDAEELPELEGVPVIIRSHGIDTETESRLAERGAVLVDATCPTVKRAQEAARDLSDAGYTVVVLGSPRHPEVRSIVGRTGGDVTVLEGVDEARRWIEGEGSNVERVGVICQTTVNRDKLDSVVEVIESKVPDVEVRDTICKSVTSRFEEALELAGHVDLMLVIGGRNSSNTTNLALICESTGVRTHHIEDSSEIKPEWLEGVESVGITGGASTPGWQIQETVERVAELDKGRTSNL